MEKKGSETAADLVFNRTGKNLLIEFTGCWKLGKTQTLATKLGKEWEQGGAPKQVTFDTSKIESWDTSFLIFLQKIYKLAETTHTEVDASRLPESARSIISLAQAAAMKEEPDIEHSERSLFYRVGSRSIRFVEAVWDVFTFLGEATVAVGHFFTGKSRFRWSDFWLIMQQTGADALPIVTLISFLIGLIMGFVGAIQLQQFGASIYVANLVGLAMVREMGAMMTGIIMCGRTGAAFAAQLGSMKVSEEIDALRTFGFSAMEFLVLPRMVALSVMMPLLVLFSDFVGIIGGLCVSLAILDVTYQQYINQTIQAISLAQFSSGLIKSVVFGILVAATGCLRGMQCGNSSSAVGIAATSAVVTGITAIIITDAIFAVIFNIFGL